MDITLALGGGGAKGNSHIGVLRRLERGGFHIRAIAGTSFGGIVAVFYAAGHTPDEIESIFSSVDQSRMYGHLPGEGPSLLGLAGVTHWLDEHIGALTFDELRIPCAVTAVDLDSACEVILSEGSVKDALLATIALPGIFPTRNIHQWNLVDGGILDPVPVSVARALAPKLPVVAVVLTAPVSEPTRNLRLSIPAYIPSPIASRLTNLRLAKAFDIFLHSVEIGNRQMTEMRLKVDRPDVVIRPAVHHVGLLEKVEVPEVAKLGDQAVEQFLPELRQMMSLPARVLRWLGR